MMPKTDRVIRGAAEGGEHIMSVGVMLAQALARSGYDIFTLTVIPAEIKGGPANFTLRADTKPVTSQGGELDALMCFNEEAFQLHHQALKPGGLLLFDPSRFTPAAGSYAAYPVQLEWLAVQEVKAATSKNVVALGVLARLLGLPLEICERMVRQKLGRRGPDVVERNLKALKTGFDHVGANPPPVDLTLAPPRPGAGERLVATGNEMISMGAIASGCRYYAGYPITPASDIMEFLEKELPKFGGFALQTEDEISAIASCVGASYAGAKAMTATSGPGLSLMTEILGLAAMTETPLVVADVQRGGPSTGLPTKTEQSDLNLAVYGGHGDAPRLVLAASDVEDCYTTTLDAFNLAEKYQMPVILLSDYSLATRTQTIPRPDFAAAKPERRAVPGPEELKAYLRYRLTPTGVSPMALPGTPGGQYTATGLEHNEAGSPHMTPETHRKMNAKRFQKLAEAAREPGFLRRVGAPDATLGIVCWGTTMGPVREALGWALDAKLPVAALLVRMLHPLPLELRAFLDQMSTVLVPELNVQGQLASLLRARFLKPVVQLNKCEGLPFSPKEIFDKIEELCLVPATKAGVPSGPAEEVPGARERRGPTAGSAR